MKNKPKISDAEWAVMKVVWLKSPLTAQEVIERLAGSRDWGSATIKTLLNRLVHKGALNFKKEGRGYLYWPKVGESECQGAEISNFLERVCGGALTPFLAHFASSGSKLRPEDIAELEKILEAARDKP